MKIPVSRYMLVAFSTIAALVISGVVYSIVPTKLAEFHAAAVCDSLKNTDTLEGVLLKANAEHKPNLVMNYSRVGLFMAWYGAGTEKWYCDVAFKDGRVDKKQVIFKD